MTYPGKIPDNETILSFNWHIRQRKLTSFMKTKKALFIGLGVAFIAIAFLPCQALYQITQRSLLRDRMMKAIDVYLGTMTYEPKEGNVSLRLSARSNSDVVAARIIVTIKTKFGDTLKSNSISLDPLPPYNAKDFYFLLPCNTSDEKDCQLINLLKKDNNPYSLPKQDSDAFDNSWSPDVFVLKNGEKWVWPKE